VQRIESEYNLSHPGLEEIMPDKFLQIVINYLVAPFFIVCGIYVIKRSLDAFRKDEFKSYPIPIQNWHKVSIVVAIIWMIMGLLILVRVIRIG
jgi:hypothetical protein